MTWIDRFPNAPYAYEYELAEGFTPAQAAGIVGNLEQESGVNPESVQQGGPGRGIAQWSQGGRWNPALMTGNPQTDLPAQLAYVMQELNSYPGYGLADLRKAQTPEQAAQVFGTEYERYGIAGARVPDARDTYDALAGSTTGAGIPTSSVPTAQLTSGFINPLDPLTWAGGLSGVSGLFSGGSMVANVGKFIAAILYGGTWIRFGEALLGTVAMSGGLALIVATVAGSPGGLSALGTVASLFPGEGTAAGLAMKTAAGVRSAGGKDTTVTKFARGARAAGTRQRGESDRREEAASRRRRSEHASYQRSQTSYRQSLKLFDDVRTRDAKAGEDDELFARSRGQARANRTGYRRHMKPDNSDLRRRTP